MTAMCIPYCPKPGVNGRSQNYGSRAPSARDPQSSTYNSARSARYQLDWAKDYLVGLTTVTEPPKFRLLLCVAAIIAAAIAPPAAASSAINAPPLRCPKVSVLVSLVQRVPGWGVPADSEVPAATAFVPPPVRNSTEPPCDATIVFTHSTSTMNVAA